MRIESQSEYKGLTTNQVEHSLREHGANILTPPKRDSAWTQLLEKFKDPIIQILIVALALSVGIACYQYSSGHEPATVFLEPLGIFIAIVLATGIGFIFELQAHKKFELLNQSNDDSTVQVMRDGQITAVPRKDIVVGDLIILNTGDEIPADANLLESVNLLVNESSLTGEPSAKKSIRHEDSDPNATYSTNCLLKGTTVIEGHATAVVTAVGHATEYGKVYEGAQIETHIQTPLNKQLHRLARNITLCSYVVGGLVILGRVLVFFNGGMQEGGWLETSKYMIETIMIAITIIIVSVPEGLPTSVVLSLALSMKRMLKANNLVRKMHACETMGAATVICTDKTGTLTQNQMRVHEAHILSLPAGVLTSEQGRVSELIAESVALNSTANLDKTTATPTVLGNPTEGALLLWLNGQERDYQSYRQRIPVLAQLTFTTERKYMATVVQSPSQYKRVLLVKGAPEIVMDLCNNVLTEQGGVPLAEMQNALTEQLLEYQNKAMRTIGMAYLTLDDSEPAHASFVDGRIHSTNLTFLGVFAIADPVRDDVPDAIRQCLGAGINIKIITGDTPATAKEIGRQVGLWMPTDSDENHISGSDFHAMSDDEIIPRLAALKIMSRARPMDKERLVRLLQDQDEVVAVTGDGTNDAPALNVAQIGLSMGDGTSVAKEASDITIMDNSFNSITNAVLWGRSLYRNIQRFILFQLTVNVVACITVMVGSFMGHEPPLTITQMLWVNLIMDTFAALALASLPADKTVMNVGPRHPREHIITSPMIWRILFAGITFTIFLLALLKYLIYTPITSVAQINFIKVFTSLGDWSQDPVGLGTYKLTIFFTIFVFFQFWNMFNAKAFMTGKSAFADMHKCLGGFALISLIIGAGQYLIVTYGGEMLSVQPISWEDWVRIIIGTSFVLWLGEIARLFIRPKHTNKTSLFLQ